MSARDSQPKRDTKITRRGGLPCPPMHGTCKQNIEPSLIFICTHGRTQGSSPTGMVFLLLKTVLDLCVGSSAFCGVAVDGLVLFVKDVSGIERKVDIIRNFCAEVQVP